MTDISDEVQAKVARCMRGAPVLELHTTDEVSRSEEEVTTLESRLRALKSGNIRMADTMVLHNIN